MPSERKFTNRLIDETSPYLLQHAHNPVDWYPWCDEAFERAASEDKPVLISIGYSACHWCHVMENESFEDEEVAAIMNLHFINIKVDMEERPDVDQIYMNFVQITTGRGGWPMNVFLTPDKRPFFGGTYFPPQPRYGMPSWRQILLSIAEAYRERRDELDHSANEILAELRRLSGAEPAGADLSMDLADNAAASLIKAFDSTNGGFGGAPKFPPAMALEFLLRYHRRTGDGRVLDIVTTTLEKMANGGIYDQLGGGFHRYSVDAVWLVPHFEKMLYDNAQLARVYLHAFQITKIPPFERVTLEVLDYVHREMLDESGGFYSTQDADSEGEEGKFFVWTPDEIGEVLGPDAQHFNTYFDVTEAGNFEGRNILHVPDPAAQRPARDLMDRLFAAREQRVKPGRDEKVLASWNGLMLAAFADAGGAMGRADYLEIAERSAAFIMSELYREGRMLRTWKDGKGKLNAYVEDYANVADGLLILFGVTGKPEYLSQARDLAETMITKFWDQENGGFFFTSSDHEQLVVRNKDLYDNATPSGNSVAADVLIRLGRITGEDKYGRFAAATLRLVSAQIRRFPQGFGRALATVEAYLKPGPEVVIVGEAGNELERVVQTLYLPELTVIAKRPGVALDALAWLEGYELVNGLPAAYVCERFICERPITVAADLRRRLQIPG